MSAQMARSFLEDIPNVADYKLLYTPVAIFGYIGYQRGFDLELSLPTWFFASQDFVATTFHLIILSMTLTALTVALMQKGDIEREHGGSKGPFRIASDLVLGLGLLGLLAVLVLHIWSLYSIYMTQIYSETLIGLILSLYQLLVAVDFASDNIINIFRDICFWILKKLML